MALDNATVQQILEQQLGEKVGHFTVIQDMLTFEADANHIRETMLFLRDDQTLRFNFLTTLCGMHFPDAEKARQFAVVYHMHNWVDNVRIRMKAFLDGESPEINSVSQIFLSANWQERETYDFFGINFLGHPQLKRILNMDEMVSFPMRREYPLEDGGRTDKDDRFFGRTTDNR